MGYRLNRLDEPIFMAVPKPMLTEFSIRYILESCEALLERVFYFEPSSSFKGNRLSGAIYPVVYS